MSELKLVPRRGERLGDQLYGQILQQIASGALKEGEKLPSENQICRSFQVSRPTVREALTRLHADGLVTTRQQAPQPSHVEITGRGVVVALLGVHPLSRRVL